MSRELEIVFLDRDGTLNRDEGYLADPAQLVLLPGAAKAVAALNAAGVKAVVISNQSGVGRGLVTPEALAQIHRRLIVLLAEQGATLDAIYFCPHRPEEACSCRKPATALPLQAARALGVDAARSATIGDKAADIDLGRRLGGLAVLVQTGEGEKTEKGWVGAAKPDYIARDVYEAVEWAISGDRP